MLNRKCRNCGGHQKLLPRKEHEQKSLANAKRCATATRVLAARTTCASLPRAVVRCRNLSVAAGAFLTRAAKFGKRNQATTGPFRFHGKRLQRFRAVGILDFARASGRALCGRCCGHCRVRDIPGALDSRIAVAGDNLCTKVTGWRAPSAARLRRRQRGSLPPAPSWCREREYRALRDRISVG